MQKPLLVIQYVHMPKDDQNHFRMVGPSGIEAYAPDAETTFERATSIAERKGFEIHDEVLHVYR